VTRPRLLDLFCGAGGASVGYHRAGFDVVGVDIRFQREYPFEVYQADALTFPLDGFDAIHASPPCQAHSSLRSIEATRSRLFPIHPDLIAPTRARLATVGVPTVIENVPGAPIRADICLCGSMFGLGAVCRDGEYRQLRRHRIFEAAGWVPGLALRCSHHGQAVGVYGHGGGRPETTRLRKKEYLGVLAECQAAMGIDWARGSGLREAIPPAYTEAIGHQLAVSIAPRLGVSA